MKTNLDPYITVTSGMSGYFAVQMWCNPGEGFGPFWEPWETGIGRYENIEDAVLEGLKWAQDEKLEFVVPKEYKMETI